jgi:hypothetical protein
MNFIRRVLFFACIGATVWVGMKINIKDTTLASSLVPFLLLWVMFDVPHFLTLGMLDLSNAIFILFKRLSISLPDSYWALVLPTDVDESGTMKQDKYARNSGYAIRKFWLKTGLEKELSSAGFTIVQCARSINVKHPLGLLQSYRIRTQLISIRDEVDSFYIEQKFISGNNTEHFIYAISYIQFKLIDENAHLRRPDIGKIHVSKIFAHALTRKMAASTSSSKTRKRGALKNKNNSEIDNIISEVATLSLPNTIRPELLRYIYHSCDINELPSQPQTPPKNTSSSSPSSSSSSSNEQNQNKSSSSSFSNKNMNEDVPQTPFDERKYNDNKKEK